jgi:hypothetical protein
MFTPFQMKSRGLERASALFLDGPVGEDLTNGDGS